MHSARLIVLATKSTSIRSMTSVNFNEWWTPRLLKRIRYWFRRWRSPSNHLKISTLPWTWVDRDHILLHAMFQVLVDFVEKENNPGIVCWECDLSHWVAWEEIMDLYHWWKYDPLAQDENKVYEFETSEELMGWLDWMYPDATSWPQVAVLKPAPYKGCKDMYRLFGNLTEGATAKQNEMMKRLVEIRPYLWT